MTRVLVTGAAGGRQGATGRGVTMALLAGGTSVRAFVHRVDDRSDQLAAAGAEVFVGDLSSVGDVRRAMGGCDRVYFSYPVRPGLLEVTTNVAAAALDNEVELIVNLSQLAAQPHHPSPASRNHWRSELIFAWSGVRVVALRPGVFFENILFQTGEAIATRDTVALPLGAGDMALPLVGAEDVAAVAAHVLAHRAPRSNEVLLVTGREALSIREVAEVVGRELGRTIRYEPTSTERWQDQIVRAEGARIDLQIEHLAALWRFLVQLGVSTSDRKGFELDTVDRVLGRPPIDLASFVRQHADRLRPPAERIDS